MKSIFVASLLLILISCGPHSKFRTDGVYRDKQGLRIELLRKQNDLNFAEYERKIRVIAPDGRNNEKLISPDTGGTVQINVYRKDPETILLRDRINYYSIVGTNIEQIGSADKRIKAKYLGCFTEFEREKMQFVPSSKKPETEPPGMMKD